MYSPYPLHGGFGPQGMSVPMEERGEEPGRSGSTSPVPTSQPEGLASFLQRDYRFLTALVDEPPELRIGGRGDLLEVEPIHAGDDGRRHTVTRQQQAVAMGLAEPFAQRRVPVRHL